MRWMGILASVGFLVVVSLLAFGIWRQDQLTGQLADLLEGQTLLEATHAERLEREIAATNTRIDQQSALVSRALGDIIPVPIPDHLDNQLAEIETLLESPDRWPPDQASVQSQFDLLGNIMGDLPTWVQEELFPRIVPLRWSLDALWYLRATADDDEDRLGLLDSLESLKRNMPRGTSSAIADGVAARIGELENDIQKADETTSREVLETGLSANATLDEMLAALDILADEGEAASSEQLGRLERSIAVYVFKDSLNQLETQLTQALDLMDETLKLAAISRTRDAMIEFQLRLASATLEDPQLETRLLETTIVRDLKSYGERLEAGIEDLQIAAGQRRAEAVRNYQVWALEQIKKVRPYEEILDIEESKIANWEDRLIGAAKKNEAKKAAQRILREEIVNRLSQIDVGLLDVAVSEWFRKVYSDRFDKLSNDEEKLALVQAFANSTKLGIGEHP